MILQGDLMYLIAVICRTGAQFYSDDIPKNYLEKELEKYQGVCDYFGGGEVRVYHLEEDMTQNI